MSFERGTIIWQSVIQGALHQVAVDRTMAHEHAALKQVLAQFNDAAYQPESNDQAHSDIQHWVREAIRAYPMITLSPRRSAVCQTSRV